MTRPFQIMTLLLGETAFATRLPSALAVVALVLLLCSFGCRFLERAGFYGDQPTLETQLQMGAIW